MKRSDGERSGWILVAVFLLIGLLCVIAAGNLAVRFAPRWTLQANMRSRLNPDSAYSTSLPGYVLPPMDPAILTPPIWINVFLTPGEKVPTRTPKAMATPGEVTAGPTHIPSMTVATASPTGTFIYFTATPSPRPGTPVTVKPGTSTATQASGATSLPPTVIVTTSLPPSNTPVPQADLQIEIDDGVSTYSAGNTLTYTVLVSNKGSGNINGAVVTAALPAQLAGWNWLCSSQTGGAGGCVNMNGSMSFSNTLSLPAASSITYLVSAHVSGNASGALTTAASVKMPASGEDTNPANNMAGDTNHPGIDLQITVDDGVTTYSPGGMLTYTVVASNNSTFTVNGAVITNTLPPTISSASWSCVPDAGAGCSTGGTGSIYDDAVILPPGSKVTYRLTASVSASAIGTITNRVSMAAPAGFVETDPGSNQAEDSNACSAGEPDVGPPNGSWYSVTPGGTVVWMLSQPIVADGDGGTPDFVYYERFAVPAHSDAVEMDWVQVEISQDGNTWYQAFYWGDGAPDVNTNLDLSLIGDLCSTELDNCLISKDRLYKNTGITVDIDGLAPSGLYPWIRIYAPPSPDDSEVDAIQPYYP